MSASGERARLFVALEVPREVRDQLAAWRDGVVAEVSGLRAVAAESMHATLCFLGSLEVGEVDAVGAACGVVDGMPSAELRVGSGIWLPPRRPGVLAVELLDVGGRLGAMQSALSAALASGGWYKPEQRPFLAHATVARVRRGVRVRRGLSLPRLPEDLAFVGSTVTLFRSRLSGAGARYEGLASVETSTAH